MGPYQVLPLCARVGLGVMIMREYSAFPKAPRLESHYQMALCHIQVALWGGGLISLKRCCRHILQPQPTELLNQIIDIGCIMVITAKNGFSDPSSNFGQGYLSSVSSLVLVRIESKPSTCMAG